jgi:serine/threonine-protein kinase
MVVNPRIEELAGAIADGRVPDWDRALSTAADALERRAVTRLRAAASVCELFTAVTSASPPAAGERQVLPAGASWGSLRIVSHVGRGRFGDVYRAWDPALEREVALKLLRETGDPDDSEHVVHEGRLLARVRHPNVVTIFGAQRIDGVTGLWMELVEGGTLAAELGERGAFSADEIAKVGVELCGALAAVHEAGVVHRDVKAQNVLRDGRGRVVLGDFGTGTAIDDAAATAGSLGGTPAYLAPEIFAGAPATSRSDIYSLGTLLFLLATGTFPVSARSLRDLRDAHAAGTRPGVRSRRPELPAPLAEAIDRALDPEAGRRCASADEMRVALQRFLDGRQPRARVRAPFGVAAAAVVLLTATAVLTSSLRTQTPVTFGPGDWMQVGSFENRTGEPVLDATVRIALERHLSRSTLLNIVPTAPEESESTPAAGGERADPRAETIRAIRPRVLLAGTLTKDGGGYLVRARLIQLVDNRLLSAFAEHAPSQRHVLDAIDRLARRVRAALGDRVSGERPPHFLVSLRALDLYAQARDLLRSASREERDRGHRLLSEALEDSPAFAAARVLRAEHSAPEHALADADQALASLEPASEPEALLLVGRAYLRKGAAVAEPLLKEQANERAVAALERLVRDQPHNVSALTHLEQAYRRTRRVDAATTLGLRLAEVGAGSAMMQLLAAGNLLAAGRVDESLQYVERARAIDPAGRSLPPWHAAWFSLVDAQRAWLRNDAEAALEATDLVARDAIALEEDHRVQGWLHLANMYLTLGRFGEAEQAISQMRAADPESPLPDTWHAVLLSAREDGEALRSYLQAKFSETTRGRMVGSLLIEAGLLDEARAVAAERPELMWSGQLALAEGRLDEAVRLLDLALERLGGRGNPGRSRIARQLAEAFTRKGDMVRAIRILEDESQQRAGTTAGISFGHEWLKVRERLARLYRIVGRIDEAEAVEVELRTLLAVADADHPIERRLVALSRKTRP